MKELAAAIRFARSAILLVGLSFGPLLNAQDYRDYRGSDEDSRERAVVNARVLDIRAVYDRSRGRHEQNCWDEPVVERPRPKAVATGTHEIVGGVVGGVVADPKASGQRRFTPTPAGSALGVAIERANEQRQRVAEYASGYNQVRYERRCETAGRGRGGERLIGYEVTFDYDGYTGQVFSERRPGRSIRVRLDEAEWY